MKNISFLIALLRSRGDYDMTAAATRAREILDYCEERYDADIFAGIIEEMKRHNDREISFEDREVAMQEILERRKE